MLKAIELTTHRKPIKRRLPRAATLLVTDHTPKTVFMNSANQEAVQALLSLSLLRVINVKIPLQPHKKYDITQYEELMAFHSLLR